MDPAGQVTVEDLRRAGEVTTHLLETHSHPCVHFIVNGANLEDVPRHLPSIIENVRWLSHPKIGIAVIYNTDNQLIRFIVATVSQFAGLHFRFAGSFDEAVAYLQILDETLPDLRSITTETVQDT